MLVPVLSPSGSWFCEGTYVSAECVVDPIEKVTVLLESRLCVAVFESDSVLRSRGHGGAGRDRNETERHGQYLFHDGLI